MHYLVLVGCLFHTINTLVRTAGDRECCVSVKEEIHHVQTLSHYDKYFCGFSSCTIFKHEQSFVNSPGRQAFSVLIYEWYGQNLTKFLIYARSKNVFMKSEYLVRMKTLKTTKHEHLCNYVAINIICWFCPVKLEND